MKKNLLLIIALMTSLLFSACSAGNTESEHSESSAETVTQETVTEQVDNSEDGSETQSGEDTVISYVISEVTTVKPNSGLPENPDRSWHENPAGLCFPVNGEMDDEADAMRSAILSHTAQSTDITGTVYYISENGSDNNDGKSRESAWKTLDILNSKNDVLKSGDAVLFERGGVFRGSVKLVSGVYYGAYGTGDKPCIYGSDQNYANTGFLNVGENLWRLKTNFKSDVGILVFNHGEAVGNRKSSRSELKNNYDFFCDMNNNNRVYLYLDEDPSDLFLSIEAGYDRNIFTFNGLKDITIENITFKYTGGHALRGSDTENITVKYCEIGYIGGSLLKNYGDGTVRYGNGVEFMNSSKNALVENCWIYQIYDSGITHQGDYGEVLNFTAQNNLIEYCGMGAIEYWHTSNANMKNVLYAGNMLRFAGYGHGGLQRPDKNMSAAIQSNAKSTGYSNNKAENFIIRDNIFELSTYQLINAASKADTPPVFSGNTYIQVANKWLGYYADNTNVRFNSASGAIIKNTWGDSEAVIVIK